MDQPHHRIDAPFHPCGDLGQWQVLQVAQLDGPALVLR
jgi:hypothetical protein